MKRRWEITFNMPWAKKQLMQTWLKAHHKTWGDIIAMAAQNLEEYDDNALKHEKMNVKCIATTTEREVAKSFYDQAKRVGVTQSDAMRMAIDEILERYVML